MKKKSSQKDIDSDLDFDDLDTSDMDFGDAGNIDDSRSPVKPGAVAKELAQEAGKGFMDSVVRKTASKALPDSYEANASVALEYADFAKETFNTSKNKVNKSLYSLGKEVKKILPFQSKMLDGFLSKYETDFEEFRSQTEEQIREGSIQSNLSSIFDKQLEIQKAFEAKRSAESQVDKKQNLVIDKANIDLLTSIENNTANQTAFTLQISKEYYRKSLELQYKSYFIQADMLKSMRDYYKGFSIQFEEIVKNTGLPDFVKLNTSERVSEILRTQFIENTYKKLFSSSDYVKNVKQKVGNLISEKISGLTDGMDQATEAIGGLNAAGEFGGGGAKVLGSVMSGMGGGILGEKLANKISPKIKDKIKDNKVINTGGNLLDMLANSPRTLFASLKGKADKGAEEYEDESTPFRFLAKKLFGGASELLGVTDPGIKKYEVKKSSILDHNKPAIFDNKVHRSITEVIPLYLAKILSENVNLRQMYKTVNLGKLKNYKDEDDKVYDYENRKLSTKEDFKLAMEKSVFKDGNAESKKSERVSSDITSLAITSSEKSGNKDDVKFLKNKNAQKTFSDFLGKAGQKVDKDNFNYDNIITNLDKNADLAELVKRNPTLKRYIDILKKNDLSKKHKNLNEKVRDVKRVYPTLAVIELIKGASKVAGVKSITKVDGDIANKLSEGFTRFITSTNSVVTLDSIISGQCFKMMTDKDFDACNEIITIFVGQCKAIKNSGDYQRETSIEVLLGVMNESLLNNFEIDPEVFQKLYDYSPILQEKGQLGNKNLIEGKLGLEDPNTEFVDLSKIKSVANTRSPRIKGLAQAKTKLSIVDQIQNSSFGEDVSKFADIKNKFTKDIGGATNYKEIASSVSDMFKSVVTQSQDTGKKFYKSATEEFSKAFDKVNTMIKDISAEKIPVIKQTMLNSADKYIADVDELIRKELEAKQVNQRQFDEVSKTLQDNVDDEQALKDLEKTLKRQNKLKDLEIKMLRQFKKNLQSSKTRISNINIEPPIDVKQFAKDAKAAFDSLMAEAKATLAEIEGKMEAEAEAV